MQMNEHWQDDRATEEEKRSKNVLYTNTFAQGNQSPVVVCLSNLIWVRIFSRKFEVIIYRGPARDLKYNTRHVH